MARLLRAAILVACLLYAGRVLAAGGACPTGENYLTLSDPGAPATLANLGITNCYYISSAGSDSNSGNTEGSPLQHLPGMPTCTGNCAAVTPGAGTGFILRGGDTWGPSNFGANWSWSGTAANPIYIGVDQTWHSGDSWVRPIWTCGGSAVCSNNTGTYLSAHVSNLIVDNIEMTGLFIPAANSSTTYAYVSTCGQNNFFENIYGHGMVYHGTINQPNAAGMFNTNGGCGKSFTLRYNVTDNSDGSDNFGAFCYPVCPVAYGNVMRYLQTGLDGTGDSWHDNLFEYMAVPPAGSAHQDAFQHTGCYSCANPTLYYNNVCRHFPNSLFTGAGHYWINGLGPGGGNPATTYFFNNILYDTAPGNMVNTGGHAIQNYGTLYFFNNTIQCGADSSMGACLVGSNTGATLNMYLSNNQWIQNVTSSPLSCTNNPGGTCSQTNDLMQTLAQANAQGYSDTSAYAFEPTSENGATLKAAVSAATQRSVCATIGSVNASAGAACQSDSTYACAYDITNHTVHCPARQTVARAAEPNIGAYQFSSAQASTPNPPADLSVSVQ